MYDKWGNDIERLFYFIRERERQTDRQTDRQKERERERRRE